MPVVAMLIIPGATAYLLTDRFSHMLVIAPVVTLVYLLAPRQGLLGKRLAAVRRRRPVRV